MRAAARNNQCRRRRREHGGIQGYVHRIGRTAVAPEKLAAENGAMVLALLVMERLG